MAKRSCPIYVDPRFFQISSLIIYQSYLINNQIHSVSYTQCRLIVRSSLWRIQYTVYLTVASPFFKIVASFSSLKIGKYLFLRISGSIPPIVWASYCRWNFCSERTAKRAAIKFKAGSFGSFLKNPLSLYFM